MLREAREQAGLSQAQLAEKLGLSQQVVSIWEKGVPPGRHWDALAEALGIEEPSDRAEFFIRLAESARAARR